MFAIDNVCVDFKQIDKSIADRREIDANVVDRYERALSRTLKRRLRQRVARRGCPNYQRGYGNANANSALPAAIATYCFPPTE